MKKKLLVSACLLGVPTRYDGESRPAIDKDTLEKIKEKYEIIPICPEVYGGLPTPRIPSEIRGDRVIMKSGADVTDNFKRGAECVAHIVSQLGCDTALLKERSPSCGVKSVYDGSFSGKLIRGSGALTKMLCKMEIDIYSEEDIDKLL